MKVKEMGKQKRQRDSRMSSEPDERLEPTFTITPPPTEPTIVTGTEIDEPVLAEPRRLTIDKILGRFVPPPCPWCARVELPNRRTTYVNGTRIENTQTELVIERSIQCPTCNRSRMNYERVPHAILRDDSTAVE